MKQMDAATFPCVIKFGLLSLLALAGGCMHQTTPVTLPTDTHKVAIVAEIPSEIEVSTIGLVSGISRDQIDVNLWQLSDVVAHAAIDAIGKRFDTVQVKLSSGPDIHGARFRNAEDLATSLDQQKQIDRSIDAYIVFWWDPRSRIGTGPASFEKLGIAKEYHALTTPPEAYADLRVTVFDARTSKVVVTENLASQGGFLHCFAVVNGLADWKDHWSELTIANQLTLREAMINLLVSCTHATLDGMRLSS